MAIIPGGVNFGPENAWPIIAGTPPAALAPAPLPAIQDYARRRPSPPPVVWTPPVTRDPAPPEAPVPPGTPAPPAPPAPTPTPPAAQPPPGWDPVKWANAAHTSPKYVIGRILSKYAPSPEGLQQALTEIRQQFPNASIVGRDKLSVPGHGVFDVLLNSGSGVGMGWAWQGEDEGSGGGASGSSGGYASGSDVNSIMQAIYGANYGTPGGPFSIATSYLDPDTQALLNFVRARVQELTRPTSDPALQNYLDSANRFASSLETPYVNPRTAETTRTLETILKAVTGEPFSDQQSAALKADAFGSLEQDRASAIRREMARLGSMGHGRDSGTMAEALNTINRGYDANRAAQTRNLTIMGIDQANRNRQEASSVAQLLREIAAQDFAMNETRRAQGVGAREAVSAAQQRARAENESRQATALALSSIPVQLADSRLQTALQVLGLSGGVSPTNIFNSLSQLVQASQANSLAAGQQNQSLWLGIGQLLGNLPWSRLMGGGAAAG